MSNDAQSDLNQPPQEMSPASMAAALSTATKNALFPEKADGPSEEIPTRNNIIRSLAAFRPQYRQLLRAGIAVMLLILAVEWVVIANRRPDPLLLERGKDYRAQFQVEINTATWVEWLQLDGIGPTTAHLIVADRKLKGPFASFKDLQRVAGIGPATLDRIGPWLTMGHDHSDSRTADVGNNSQSGLQPETKQRQPASLRRISP